MGLHPKFYMVCENHMRKFGNMRAEQAQRIPDSRHKSYLLIRRESTKLPSNAARRFDTGYIGSVKETCGGVRLDHGCDGFWVRFGRMGLQPKFCAPVLKGRKRQPPESG